MIKTARLNFSWYGRGWIYDAVLAEPRHFDTCKKQADAAVAGGKSSSLLMIDDLPMPVAIANKPGLQEFGAQFDLLPIDAQDRFANEFLHLFKAEYTNESPHRSTTKSQRFSTDDSSAVRSTVKKRISADELADGDPRTGQLPQEVTVRSTNFRRQH